jgi:hypothetical protein
VIAYFVSLLRHVAPAEMRFPISSAEAIVESIACLVRAHLIAGTAEELPDLTSDIAYLSLMPYVGLESARRWADGVTVR